MPPKPRSPKPTENKSKLLSALEFCSTVTEREGHPYETHVGLNKNWAIAFNGIVAAGAPIDEDIYCYPNAKLITDALAKCEESFSLTQMDNGRLSIKSGKFKAIVPCLDPTLMQIVEPDPSIVGITNKFKEAVEAVGVLANENEQHVLTASILMNGQSVIATNRVMIFEAWHGLDLPSKVPLPKQFVSALVKQKKNLASFGLSNSSTTFYFEDGSWLKTQLYNAEWPDITAILNKPANLWSIDPNFFNALSAVMPFSEDGNVYLDGNVLRSHNSDKLGASFECNGLPKGAIYPAKQLILLKPHVKQIDFMATNNNGGYFLKFEGDTVRGMIAGRNST